ncbi:MAG: DUF4411 family protein [Bifidobacterium psychraerophilum]|uniref:DUF4411 family protein n=1 Tax=Bifidobacterium psychraerophilum TaxID=218140 RepID=UPI0039E7ED9F
MTFLLDTNVFTQSNRLHYAQDIVPGYWEWLDRALILGEAVSINKVYAEMAAGNDAAFTWAKPRKSYFPAFQASNQTMKRLTTWTSKTSYRKQTIAKFFDAHYADMFLVAYAMDYPDTTVVTYEKSAPKSLTNIKIPDACAPFNIRCIDPFTMLRETHACFR